MRPSDDTSGLTAQPERLRKRSGVRSLRVGEHTITYLPDGMVQIKPTGLYPQTTAQDWARSGHYLDPAGFLTASSGALLIERDDRAMLIDSGYGPLSVPASPANPVMGAISGGDLLTSLAVAGRKPADIESIAFSHLHMDHVGWAALPAADNPFPGAVLLVHEPEWRERRPAAGVSESMLASMSARVNPVTDGEEIFPGVRVQALPGHTPGHAGFRIGSGGHELIAFGDIMHSAFQVSHPELQVIGDPDPESARQSRQRILDELAVTGKVGYGCHFADVVFGRVRDTGEAMEWIPLL
jgi:glyoxylase-like metal-dependent hydrolase (beta-lactamase superfamily II)